MSRRYTKVRLAEAGEKSARRTQAEHRDLVFGCVFRGVNDEAGNIDPNTKITATSQAAFEWRVHGGCVDEAAIVTARCDHASVQGVPFPPSWKTAAKCRVIGDVAKASAANEWSE